METRLFKLKPQKSRLHSGYPLFIRLLFTAFCAAAVLAAGLYGFKMWLEPSHAEIIPPASQLRKSAALPRPEEAVLHYPSDNKGTASGSLALVKPWKYSAENHRERPRSPARAAERPLLRPVAFGDSGGNFPELYRAPEAGVQPPPAPRPRISEGEIFLSPSDLRKKVKVKGSKPVSKELAKRYSGVDPEAERLREQLRAKTAAAEAFRKRLLREKAELLVIIIILGLAVMLLGSRIIRALRLLKRPEGSHWTLKQ